MKNSPVLLLAALFLSSASLADDHCAFQVIPANSGDFVDQLEQMAQTGCDSLNKSLPYDESRAKLQAHSHSACCKHANKFISDHAAVCSDEGRLRSKIELTRELCDGFDSELVFSRAVCFSNLTYKIEDSGVQGVSDQCLKKKHEADNQVYGHPEQVDYPETVESDCVSKGLRKRSKQLPIEKLNPSVDAASCAETRSSDVQVPAKAAADTGGASGPLVDPARSGF